MFLSKHILQLLEEALALFVVLLFQGALKLLQGIPLGLVQLLGDLHLTLDVHIAPAAAVQILDALAAQAEGGAALGAFGHGVLHLAVNGRHGDAVAQNRLAVGNGHRDPDIIAIALEHLAGPDRDHHDHITGRAAVGTGIAHAAQRKALIVVDAHGDGHLQRFPGGSFSAAVADLAGVLDQLALAAAAGAGLLGLHHAKGGALLPDDIAAAAAVRAGLGAAAGGAAAAMALRALLLAGDGDVLLAAMHGLIKAQGDPHTDILTLAGGVGVCLTGRAAKAAETAAKDITEDVAQIDPIAAKAAEAARAAAHAHWASLAKPLGGLGALETLLEDAAALTGTAQFDFSRRTVAVLCADNGVVAQGVSQTDQSVTRTVAENLAARRTSVCRMAQAAHCDVLPVDMGIAGARVSGVRDCRIAAGTADFTKGPAMTRAEAVEAIGRGIALTRQLAAEGYGLVATGEMGIGNTTTSSAVAAVLLAQPVQTMTGRGAGLSDAGLARKVDAIRRGIACNSPDPDDALDVLSKLGGFDIAGLCGMFLGGALAGVPVLMDGFISGVAALCAVRLCPAAAKAVFASHCSTEPAARLVLEALGKAPLLTAGLHLGEGTGAVASIPLWDMALAVYRDCYSFTEGGITPYTPQC